MRIQEQDRVPAAQARCPSHPRAGVISLGGGPQRCLGCGHRQEPLDSLGRVIQTRDLPLLWQVHELPGRWQARRIGRQRVRAFEPPRPRYP